ncbi:MAG: DUF975 family protein [Clostridia bacterium]|nr:DUF975 family protein [Clostridia bacterium]
MGGFSMYYDRREVKLAAKAVIRETNPKPIWITLAYLMMVSLVSFVVTMLFMAPYFIFIGELTSGQMRSEGVLAFIGGLPLLLVFVTILLMLYTMVMQYGYCKYIINVKRRLPSGFHDLFSGFSRVGRVLMLNLLIFVFTFLWSMLGMVGLMALIMIPLMLHSEVLSILCMIVGYIGFFIFLLNRTLRYALALLVMVDHPELTAREVLNESKAIMRGNLWNLFALQISFIGWDLLLFAISYAMILPGLYLTGFYANPEGAIIPFILICIVAFIVTAFLSMWVSAYQSVAFVGFYDAINGFDGPMAMTADDVSPSVPTMIPPQFESPAPTPDSTQEPSGEPEAPDKPEIPDEPDTTSETGDPEL